MMADKILVVIEILVVKEICGYLDGARTRFGPLLCVVARATNGDCWFADIQHHSAFPSHAAYA